MSNTTRTALRLAVPISGRGSNMVAIARACRDKRIAAQVSIVIADRPSAGGVALAREMGIDAQVVPWSSATGGPAFERALIECIDAHHPDLIILAGFMRILSRELVEHYAGRMLNIHPSLLPAYRGLQTHVRVLQGGDAWHGASVHFVTAELDGGPVILQSRVPVKPDDTEASLAARVLSTEHEIYPRVIGWIADGRLAWCGGRPSLDGEPLQQPVVENFGALQDD
ncbi:MAG TPA: phosphoribosylglycinamide formyltransferase [Steroidobacteraceae bacterium]|nr:phosphoribosylglycinamide formyltransferase [Steroidobacteraceae bacterium]